MRAKAEEQTNLFLQLLVLLQQRFRRILGTFADLSLEVATGIAVGSGERERLGADVADQILVDGLQEVFELVQVALLRSEWRIF